MTLLSGRISTLVVYQLPKLRRRVRFPYPALYDGREKNSQSDLAVLFLFHAQETRRHGCLRVSWLPLLRQIALPELGSNQQPHG